MDTVNPTESTKPAGQSTTTEQKGLWNAILTATPIALTVLATAFAGLSSSEMTQSMYYRSLASQQQSKAGDQWAYFQAKKIRATSLEVEIDLLQTLAHAETFDPAQIDGVLASITELLVKSAGENDPKNKEMAKAVDSIKKARAKLTTLLNDEKTRASLAYLTGGAPLPKIEPQSITKKEVQEKIVSVVKAINARKPESETDPLVATLDVADIKEATTFAEEAADNFDKACDPLRKVLKEFRAILGEVASTLKLFRKATPDRSDTRDPAAQALTFFDGVKIGFRVTERDFDSRRYQEESTYNQRVAELYEVQVRHSGYQSDRHRIRSQRFFISMLVAQAGVTIASLALARKQHSLLWLLAAAAGITALGFCGYVYVLY